MGNEWSPARSRGTGPQSYMVENENIKPKKGESNNNDAGTDVDDH